MRDDRAAEQVDKIKAILEWAKENPDFDKGFVESMNEKLERWGDLSPGQEGALDNIISGFKIDI